MLHRTAPINFQDVADEDYDYSDPENLEPDLELPNQKGASRIEEKVTKPIFSFSLEHHLSNIKPVIPKENHVSTLTDYDDVDFKLDQVAKLIQPRPSVEIKFSECIIIDIAHPAQYKIPKSEYLLDSPYYLTWTYTDSASQAEFPSIVQTNIKLEYQAIKSDLKFVHFVAPAAERMSNLCHIRKEVPYGRILFHYIGFGLPTIENGTISVCDGRSLKAYSVGKIFEDIQTPSWFIFDSNNSGSFIPAIMQRCQKLQASGAKNPRQNWCDWYCLCATSEGESLPQDPKLPRDFLTTCLLTPVKLSILCHILKYFRVSLDDPLSYLSNFEFDADLYRILNCVTDAIISDFVKPKFFFLIFRHEKLVGTFFRHFILAQYLLYDFDVHPISNPTLPDMTQHQLWQQWTSTIDIWITSNLTPAPSFCHNYFGQVSQIFSIAVKSSSSISRSTLVTMCYAALDDPLNFIPIAEYASKSSDNRQKLTTTLLFDKIFRTFIATSIGPLAFDSLCYIIISLIQQDYSLINEIKKDMNLSSMINFIFDQSFKEITRAVVTSILASVVQENKSVFENCSSKSFLLKLSQSIVSCSDEYSLWLLLLFKRRFGMASCDMSLFYNESIHWQISQLLTSKSPEVRAATIAALTCFMQSDEYDVLNCSLLMISFPALFDVSYFVRYQFLLLVIRFLQTHQNEVTDSLSEFIIKKPLFFYSNIFNHWFKNISLEKAQTDFISFAKEIDGLVRTENFLTNTCVLSLFVIKYMSFDPHPSIKSTAHKAKEAFDRLLTMENCKDNEIRCRSISPPFGWHQLSVIPNHNAMIKNVSSKPLTKVVSDLRSLSNSVSNSTSSNSLCSQFNQSSLNQAVNEFTSLFESDSNALYSIMLRRLVSNGSKFLHPSDVLAQISKRSSSQIGGKIDIPTVHLQLRSQTRGTVKNPIKICCDIENTETFVACRNKWVYHLDSSLDLCNKVRISESQVTDMKMYNSDITVVSCSDGTIRLLKRGQKDCCACFRADTLYEDTQNNLVFDPHRNKQGIITGRNGIQFFDLNSQKFVSEWKTTSRITALALHPNNHDICVVGFDNGNISALDLRMKNESAIENGMLFSFGIKEPIVKVMSNNNGAEYEYGATISGKILEWNSTAGSIQIIKTNLGAPLFDFDVHKTLPLWAISSTTDSPAICNPKGQILYKVKDMPPGSVFAFHPILPIITFGSPDSDILSYNILLSADQK